MDVRMKFTYSEPDNFSVAKLAVKNAAAITVHTHELTCKPSGSMQSVNEITQYCLVQRLAMKSDCPVADI
jgi:hypothetical protein